MPTIVEPIPADSLAWKPPLRAKSSALLLPAIGLGFSLLFGVLNYIRAAALNPPANLNDIVIEGLSRWMLYAALAPVVAALVSRSPLSSGPRTGRLLLHLAAMAGLAFVHNVLVATVYAILHVYPKGSPYLEAVWRLFAVYFAVNFVIFCAIDGAYHAVRYHHEVRAREQLAADLRAQLATAQLDGLRAQLNPHFLFNTLNAVSSLALSGQQEQVVQTLSRLSDLLRVSLDRDLPQEVSLDRELEILGSYLEIQSIRFGARVCFPLEIEPGVGAALIPSMILQPLVENAIQHGIAVRPGPGRVVIRAGRRGEQLCLRVEDTGPGFVPGASPHRDRGIGLANTRARLAQLYGEEQSLECGNLPEGGAVVQVLLPLHGLAGTGHA